MRATLAAIIFLVSTACSTEADIETLIDTDIPSGMKPVQTIDASNSKNESYKIVRYKIDEGFSNLIEENADSKYKFRLPIQKEDLADSVILKYVSSIDDGFYICRHDYDSERD